MEVLSVWIEICESQRQNNEGVKKIMSDVDVQKNNLLGVKKRVKWLKEDFSKHELDRLKKMTNKFKRVKSLFETQGKKIGY